MHHQWVESPLQRTWGAHPVHQLRLVGYRADGRRQGPGHAARQRLVAGGRLIVAAVAAGALSQQQRTMSSLWPECGWQRT